MNIVTTFAKIITMKTLNVALILSLGLLVILTPCPSLQAMTFDFAQPRIDSVKQVLLH